MSTLKELQANMQSANDATKQAATKALADYYYVYNEEYNALLTSKENADAVLYQTTHNPAGVDISATFQLRSMILALQARMVKLDEKMLSFHASTLSITPADQSTIDAVKILSGQVVSAQIKATVIDRILDSFKQLAQLTGKIQGT